MASRFAKLLTRAAVPRAGLGNLLIQPRPSGGKGPIAGTRNVSWQSPGQPQILDQDLAHFGEEAYLNSVHVMRCVRTIADTIAGLEFRAGLDPENPADFDPTAPLAQLLGPATPQAPGGPNPEMSSRAFWAWTLCQYVVYGRFAWECQLDQKQIIGLWPLVAACIKTVPSQGGNYYFDSYIYTTPMDGDIPMKKDSLIYGWRSSLQDPRVPESPIQAAKLPIYIAKGFDRYTAKLLQNDMVASTLVVTPPFEEASARRSWQEQFNTTFSGIDARGKTIFVEADYDENDTSGKPLVQVEKIGQTAVESSQIELSKTAKEEIMLAMGVPESLIGNASQRIYANADSETKTFWTLTVMNILTEFQDHINLRLAPRVGREVGWFDLSRVAVLRQPSIFAPPMVGDLINFDIASAAQIANVLGIPAADTVTGAEDSDTIELDIESSSTGAGMGGARSGWSSMRVTKDALISARLRYEKRSINSHNWDNEFDVTQWLSRPYVDLGRPIINARSIDVTPTAAAVESAEATAILSRVTNARSRHEMAQLERRKMRTAELVERTTQTASDYRALAVASRTTKTVHTKLSETYPESTLKWVDDADWVGPQQVNLTDIEMSRRPGARDPKKVAGIAQGIAAGDKGAAAAVVLVKVPGSDKLKVADGYHRTKAHEKLGHKTVAAYVGSVDDDEGPWDTEMHDKKLNRAATVTGPPGQPVKWVGLDGKLHDDLDQDLVDEVQDHAEPIRTDTSLLGDELKVAAQQAAEAVEITPYAGTDFGQWMAENEDGLLALVGAEE